MFIKFLTWQANNTFNFVVDYHLFLMRKKKQFKILNKQRP